MNITLNGEPETLPDQMTAQELVAHLQLSQDRLALVVNGQIIPKSRQDTTPIEPGDRVDIITMVGGG